jgi:hypothetical protein
MKVCPKCKKELSFDNYNFDKNGKINTAYSKTPVICCAFCQGLKF